MISTIKPYGSINESVAEFLIVIRGKFYVVDRSANQWEIDKHSFDYLSSKGLRIKEV